MSKNSQPELTPRTHLSEITPSSTSQDTNIEAQTQSSDRSRKLQAPRLTTADPCESSGPSTHNNSSAHNQERSCSISRGSEVTDGQKGDQDATETSHNAPQADILSLRHDTRPSTDLPTQSEWKPWKADEPLRTKVPKNETAKEDWVEAMSASDDGMCKGWRDQIDTLIIFAGLFSATVTAFTVESYKWLDENPADTLARLQLRDRLNMTHDPAMDRLAPATFNVSSASVAINTLWFASLTLSLAAVVISILCKQWLYEYQRYDNFTTNEAFLIHGLRHRGLHAWRVPEIISSLPILLQTALVFFLVGILVLLWPLQTIVVSITTIIVGLTFLFLVITTALPTIQYIVPLFDTQCAYKSSQSWSFFLASAFWRFDFCEFTGWASFDRWEVTHIHDGTGHTLSMVCKLLWNSTDAVLSIYSTLADISLEPIIDEDLALLSDFVYGLDASQKQELAPTIPKDGLSRRYRRIEQLRHYLYGVWNGYGRLKPDTIFFGSEISPPVNHIDHAYYLGIHRTLGQFLASNDFFYHPALFNRYVEHWARSLDIGENILGDGTAHIPWVIYSTSMQYDPEIAKFLVEFHAHLFKKDRISLHYTGRLIPYMYLGLVESYHQHNFNPPPVTLLKDIQEWVNRVPESDLLKKNQYAEQVLLCLSSRDDFCRKFFESHTSDSEKQYLSSFAHFFVSLHEREDLLQARKYYMRSKTGEVLAFFREYLNQNPVASS